VGQAEGNRAHSGTARTRHYSSNSFQRSPLLTSSGRGARKNSTLTEASPTDSQRVPDDSSLLKSYLQDLDWIDARPGKEASMEIDMRKAKFLYLVKGIIPDDDSSTEFDRAWEAFNDLKESDQNTDAKILLANFLSFSDRESDSIRLLFLTNGNDFETTFAVWRAIVIHLFAGNLTKAAEIHEAAQRQNIRSYTGSDVLLAHAIQAEDWKLALRTSTTVFNNLTRPYDRGVVQEAVHNLWDTTTRLPNLRQLVSKFLAFAYERLDLQYFVIKAFVSHFLLATLSSIPQSTTQVKDFLEEVQIYRIDEKPLLQFALEKIVHTSSQPGQALDIQLYEYLGSIWSAYRKFCGPGDINVSLIHDILRLFTRPGTSRSIPAQQERRLVMNILSACSTKGIALPYEIMVAIMVMHAWRGNTDTVRYLNSVLSPRFGELNQLARTETEQKADADRAFALLLVHVEHGEDGDAEKVLTRLRSLYPDIVRRQEPWRALIQLYARQRRFGKVFDIMFNRMIEAGAPPTRELLQMVIRDFGNKGNVPAVSALLSLAKANGIALTMDMVEYLVVAHIRNGDSMAAEEIASMIQEFRDSVEMSSQSSLLYSQLYSATKINDMNTASGIYKRMLSGDTRIDRFAFIRMIDLYTRNRRTNDALKVAFEDMPTRETTCGAHLYGLLVRGYWHEHRYVEAIEMFDRMVYAGETPDVTGCNYWVAALCQLSRSNPESDRDVLAGLRALISGRFADVVWIREWPPTWHRNSYDVYFAGLFERYAEVQAWDVLNYLQKWYRQLEPNEPPLGVIKALMKANCLAGQHDEVEKLFNIGLSQLSRDIKTMANDLTSLSLIKDSTFDDINNQQLWPNSNSKVDTSMILDAVKKPLAEYTDLDAGTAHDIRHLVGYLLLDYITSLVAQNRFDDLIRTFARLQALGFNLKDRRRVKDYRRVWNHYVQALCKSPEPRHIITAFRAAEYHLYSKHAIFRDEVVVKPELRLGLTKDKEQSRFDEKRVEPRTMVILKEIAMASRETSVNHAVLGIGQSEEVFETDTVTLSSVLLQVAPRMFPAVLNWNGNRYVRGNRRNDYFKTPIQLLALKDKQTRDAWWQKTSQQGIKERLQAYGPPRKLEPFTQLTESETAQYGHRPTRKKIEDDRSIRSLGAGEEAAVPAAVTAEEVLRALQSEQTVAHAIERPAWEKSLYAPLEEEKAKASQTDDTEFAELGVDTTLEQQEEAIEEEEKASSDEKKTRYNPEKLFADIRQKVEDKKGERFWMD
jgi:hypothetical protein